MWVCTGLWRLGFVVSVQVKELGEDNGKVGEREEVGCAV